MIVAADALGVRTQRAVVAAGLIGPACRQVLISRSGSVSKNLERFRVHFKSCSLSGCSATGKWSDASRLFRLHRPALAEPISKRQYQHDDGEHDRETQDPDKLRRVDLFLKIEIPCQRIDCRDADDRAQEPLLQLTKINLKQTLGPFLPRLGVDLANEILIAGEDHD